MTVVVDIGCARHGESYSIERLITMHKPRILYGFDPTTTPDDRPIATGNTQVVLAKSAAWTYDGTIRFVADGTRSHVTVAKNLGEPVPCFNLAQFLLDLREEDVILKIDAEGAEYILLEHLIAKGSDERLSFAWVEWHPDAEPERGMREDIERRIACELKEWRW